MIVRSDDAQLATSMISLPFENPFSIDLRTSNHPPNIGTTSEHRFTPCMEVRIITPRREDSNRRHRATFDEEFNIPNPSPLYPRAENIRMLFSNTTTSRIGEHCAVHKASQGVEVTHDDAPRALPVVAPHLYS
jgi:hypothetical protein